jgi:hypothetical protein
MQLANNTLTSIIITGVKDSGFTAASMGYLYKIYIPVYTNRSVESAGVL